MSQLPLSPVFLAHVTTRILPSFSPICHNSLSPQFFLAHVTTPSLPISRGDDHRRGAVVRLLVLGPLGGGHVHARAGLFLFVVLFPPPTHTPFLPQVVLFFAHPHPISPTRRFFFRPPTPHFSHKSFDFSPTRTPFLPQVVLFFAHAHPISPMSCFLFRPPTPHFSHMSRPTSFPHLTVCFS